MDYGLVTSLLKLRIVWMGIALVIAMGMVGNMDFEDAVLQRNHYCNMVAEGYWPDYDRIYKDECLALGYPAIPADLHPAGDTDR